MSGERENIKSAALKTVKGRFDDTVIPLLSDRLSENYTGNVIVEIRIRNGFLRTISYNSTQLENFQYEEVFRKTLTENGK